MEIVDWKPILDLIIGIPSLLVLIGIAYKDRRPSIILFSLSLFIFLIGVGVPFFLNNEEGDKLHSIGDLISITTVLSALLIKTRNSKPKFARFPLYLAFLPCIGLFFFPLIQNEKIIIDMLNIIYQGGAILVGILVASMNNYLYKNRFLLVLGSFFFLISYLFSWPLTTLESVTALNSVSALFFIAGIISCTLGFRKISLINN